MQNVEVVCAGMRPMMTMVATEDAEVQYFWPNTFKSILIVEIRLVTLIFYIPMSSASSASGIWKPIS